MPLRGLGQGLRQYLGVLGKDGALRFGAGDAGVHQFAPQDAAAVGRQDQGGMGKFRALAFVYRHGSVDLQAGDQLFLYTDGVTEAFNPDGQEYGDARLAQVLHAALAATDHAPAHIAAQVLADVHAFERGAPQADDITCVALRYLGS